MAQLALRLRDADREDEPLSVPRWRVRQESVDAPGALRQEPRSGLRDMPRHPATRLLRLQYSVGCRPCDRLTSSLLLDPQNSEARHQGRRPDRDSTRAYEFAEDREQQAARTRPHLPALRPREPNVVPGEVLGGGHGPILSYSTRINP